MVSQLSPFPYHSSPGGALMSVDPCQQWSVQSVGDLPASSGSGDGAASGVFHALSFWARLPVVSIAPGGPGPCLLWTQTNNLDTCFRVLAEAFVLCDLNLVQRRINLIFADYKLRQTNLRSSVKKTHVTSAVCELGSFVLFTSKWALQDWIVRQYFLN